MKSQHNIPDWNKDGVWSNVEAKLRQKRKRRFLFWWFMGGASTVLLVGFLIWFNNEEVTKNALKENTLAQREQIRTPEEIQNNSSLGTTNTFDKKSKQEREASITAFELSTNKKLSASNQQQLPLDKIKATPEEITPEELSISATALNSKKITQEIAIAQHLLIEKITSPSALTKEVDLPDFLPMLPVDLATIHFNRKDSTWAKRFDSSLPEYSKEKRASTVWWVESGLNVGKRSFNNLNERTAVRNATEQFRFMHTSAIGIQRFLNKNWSLKLGLAYQTIYEKYEHAPLTTEEVQVFADSAIVYDLPSEVIYFEAGLTTLRTAKTRHIIHNNFIHRLSVPVEIAYSWKNDNWSLAPSLGFRFQYFQRFNGIIAQNGDHFFDLATINDTYFSNKTSIGLLTSLNLKYKISHKGALGLRVSYEMDDFLKLIKNDFYSSYETLGLQLGYYHSL